MANTKISALPAWTPTDVAEIPFVEWGVTYKGLKSLLQGADGNWIASIALLSTVWLIKTYRITYTDATTFDYFTTDGIDWAWTVSSIVWWANTTVDNTDPTNPIVNTTQIDISWKQNILLEWAFVNWDKTKLDSAVTLIWSETLTNKTITTRTNTITSSTTPTPIWDTTDEFTVTALAVWATFAAPTWTPTEWQVLLIRIKDNATAQTLAWNSIYRASSDLALPTTTIISKTLYLQFVYHSTDSKFDLLWLLDNF